jgi:hypothetical protein
MYHYHELLPLGVQGYLPALRAQETSLKYLKHIGGREESYIMSVPICPDNLSCLTGLRILELSLIWVVQHNLAEYGVPPNLETLRFLHVDHIDFDALVETDTNLIETLGLNKPNRLQRLDIVLTTTTSENRFDIWRNQARRNRVSKLAFKLRKQQVELWIYTLSYSEEHYIPPYMYGEEVPKEELIYCSLNSPQFGGLIHDDSTSSQEEHVDVILDID